MGLKDRRGEHKGRGVGGGGVGRAWWRGLKGQQLIGR